MASCEISGLKDKNNNLEAEINHLRTEITDLTNQLNQRDKEITSLLDEIWVFKELLAPISPPDIVGIISHNEIIDLLREYFPYAMFRGVEAPEFKLTTLEEIERFLQEDDTDILPIGENKGDYIFRLIGEFSQPGWEEIPVGWIKESDGDINIIVIVLEEGNAKILVVDPTTDSFWWLEEANENIMFVLV